MGAMAGDHPAVGQDQNVRAVPDGLVGGVKQLFQRRLQARPRRRRPVNKIGSVTDLKPGRLMSRSLSISSLVRIG